MSNWFVGMSVAARCLKCTCDFFSLKAYISRTLVKEVVCSPLELFACVTVVKAQKNSDMTNLQFTIIIKKTCRQLKVKVSQGNRFST